MTEIKVELIIIFSEIRMRKDARLSGEPSWVFKGFNFRASRASTAGLQYNNFNRADTL